MKLAQTIIHQQQPTEKTCVAACIGMLLGINTKRIINEFHKEYISGKEIDSYLAEHGIITVPMISTDRRSPEPGSLYIIAVPSLNLEAHSHQIIFDYRNPENFKVFDPNMGRAGKKYYVWKNEEDLHNLEVNILSYVYDFEIKWKES